MTIPQLKGFMEAILRRTAMTSAIFVTNVAVGAQSDSKGIKKAIEGYTKQREKKKNSHKSPPISDNELFGIQ